MRPFAALVVWLMCPLSARAEEPAATPVEAVPPAAAPASDAPAAAPSAPAAAPSAPADASGPAIAAPAPAATTFVVAPVGVAPVEDDEPLPIPTMKIDRIPPRASYELGVQFGYVDVPYFRKTVGEWIGFGLRGAYGKNIGAHRVGVEGLFQVEGPFGVQTSFAIEPRFAWDYILGADRGLQLGASLGPSLGYHNQAIVGPSNNLVAVSIAPALAVRVGYSEQFSRVGRRFFVFAEPRLRYAPAGEAVDQPFSPGINVVIGSGRGI